MISSAHCGRSPETSTQGAVWSVKAIFVFWEGARFARTVFSVYTHTASTNFAFKCEVEPMRMSAGFQERLMLGAKETERLSFELSKLTLTRLRLREFAPGKGCS